MDSLSATFSALAHPARRAILSRLATGDATVNQLPEPFRLSRSTFTLLPWMLFMNMLLRYSLGQCSLPK
jgi:hypothetical protein